MNHLAMLKAKMLGKPTIHEKEPVLIVINNEKINNEKINNEKINEPNLQEAVEEGEKGEGVEGEKMEEGVEGEKMGEEFIKQIIPVTITLDNQPNFDRNQMFSKLKQKRQKKVIVNPIVEIEQQGKITQAIDSLQQVNLDKIKSNKLKKLSLPFVIEEDENEDEGEDKAKEEIAIKISKKIRLTKPVEKGIAVLGPETIVEFGDTDLTKRLPKKESPVVIKVSSYYMNDREIFINFINSVFEPYKQELEENKENISCDMIGQTSIQFSLLTHQKIVRDYMNLYTPYRGLLLYHGLGSGKTCTSIGIAEGMKDSKRIIIMTPASLRANYIEELKKCGDLIYKRNQYWEWISIVEQPDTLEPMSAILNLPMEYIRKSQGAFFINIKKQSNYDDLSDEDRVKLENQINEMIQQKYTFINYNGLRSKKLEQLTSGFKNNLFDNSVVIIDEAHNLISRIVNKIKKEKDIYEDNKGNKEHLPLNLATKIYEYLLSAKNARIILLTGTPVINYPNEFGILFNVLRGYIKTWKIPLNIKTNKKIDKNYLQEILMGEKSLNYIDYSPSSKMLTITRNPFGFKNKIKKDSGYQGVTNVKKNEKGENLIDSEFISDDEFERKIINILRRNDIDIIGDGIKIQNKKALPDKMDDFLNRFIDSTTLKLKNSDALKRRIIGLSSYFRSAQESLLPKYNRELGVDYHIIRITMSDAQFRVYESARQEERKSEKIQKTSGDMLKEEQTSTYRIFSRLFCNYIIPERPIPGDIKLKKNDKMTKEEDMEEVEMKMEEMKIEEKKGKKKGKKDSKEETKEDKNEFNQLLKQAKKMEQRNDLEDENEGELEGDDILNNIGGIQYKERLNLAIQNIDEHPEEFLTPDALQTYSPKFLHILENVLDANYEGLHLIYSQFRTAEGIGIFSLVLNHNGFTRFKIKKNPIGVWEINIPLSEQGKPTYALYTGTETSEEKEIIRHIYNGEWDDIPESISKPLKTRYRNNNMGEVIKILMITSSGSEGINLRNTRYVHIMEPYWHPVRLEQVIGRARRICSHKELPQALQTVEVFVYLMVFSSAQLESDEAIELKRKDLSKAIPRLPQTSDQYLYEISEIKASLTTQLTDAIKESAFDCYIYSNGKCINFGDPTNDKFSYVPDYTDQPNDTTVKANKIALEWVGKVIRINRKEYVYRRINKKLLNIYDKSSYEAALQDSSIIPLQIGTLETNDRGEEVFKQLVV